MLAAAHPPPTCCRCLSFQLIRFSFHCSMSTKDDPVSIHMRCEERDGTRGGTGERSADPPCSLRVRRCCCCCCLPLLLLVLLLCVQVCAKPELDEKAHSKCTGPFSEYEACAKRVASGKVEAGKNCGGYYGEYWQCIDKTVRAAARLNAHIRIRVVRCSDTHRGMSVCVWSRCVQNAKALFRVLK